MQSLASLSRSLSYCTCPACDELYPRGAPCPCRGRPLPPLPRWLRVLAWLAMMTFCGLAWGGMVWGALYAYAHLWGR